MKLRSILAIPSVLLLLVAWIVVARAKRYRVPNRMPTVGMVWIPSGKFLMGSPSDEAGRDPHEVQHPVKITGFWMGRHLVTQAEWASILAVNPSYFRGSPQLPVEGVTWYDCIAYCNLRSRKEGLTPCYDYAGAGTDPGKWPIGWKQEIHDHISCDWSADGYRLPTEAEWEYACRAGTTTATAFGDRLTSHQGDFNGEEPYNCLENGPNLQRTTQVGQYPPNAWGLYDMHGNTSQWCWDWFADYDPHPQIDPRGPAMSQGRRVFRGGSWFSHGNDLRSATRFSDTPCFRLDMLPGGLRVARSATPSHGESP